MWDVLINPKDNNTFYNEAQDVLATTQPNYLGDFKLVHFLLRNFAADILTAPNIDKIEEKARTLADIFLGKDERYPHSGWNTPGQIDVYLSQQEGVDSEDSQEVIAGVLVSMITELLELGEIVHKNQLIEEQWQEAALGILHTYASKFLGMPEYGLEDVSIPISNRVKTSPFRK